MKKRFYLISMCVILLSFLISIPNVYAKEGLENDVLHILDDMDTKWTEKKEEKDKWKWPWEKDDTDKEKEEKKKDKWKWPWEKEDIEEQEVFYEFDYGSLGQVESTQNAATNTETEKKYKKWIQDILDFGKKFSNDTGDEIGEITVQTLVPSIYFLSSWGDALVSDEEEVEPEDKGMGDIIWDNLGAVNYYSSKWSGDIAEKLTDPLVNTYQDFLGSYLAKEYHKPGFTGELVGEYTNLGNNVIDTGSVLIEMGQLMVSDDVDRSLQFYEKTLDAAEPMVNLFCQAFGIPEETFAAPLFVLDGLSGAWEELRKTPKYIEWKSQFRTEEAFNEAFWDMTWEGIGNALLDIPYELGWLPRIEVHSGYVYVDTGDLWDYVFKTVKKADGSITISFTDYQIVPSGKVPVYKPNIYFYSEETLEADIVFLQENLLTETIPVYQDGWHIEVLEDGKIAWEQQKYDFLFYESLTDKTLNQYEKGWYISCEEREKALKSVLELYQFNEKESEDFMEFWMDKLEANKNYMMYPQETECVDCQMPVSISPAPDSIRRIWFGFEEVSDAKENISEPEVDEIKREGFTVVEWGGFLLNNAIVE